MRFLSWFMTESTDRKNWPKKLTEKTDQKTDRKNWYYHSPLDTRKVVFMNYIKLTFGTEASLRIKLVSKCIKTYEFLLFRLSWKIPYFHSEKTPIKYFSFPPKWEFLEHVQAREFWAPWWKLHKMDIIMPKVRFWVDLSKKQSSLKFDNPATCWISELTPYFSISTLKKSTKPQENQ